MSDLRERLRICSLAQLSLLEITCISSLIREPTEPATKRLSRRTFFLFLSRTPRGLCRLSVPRRPPLRRAAASLPHHQPAPPPRSPRSAAGQSDSCCPLPRSSCRLSILGIRTRIPTRTTTSSTSAPAATPSSAPSAPRSRNSAQASATATPPRRSWSAPAQRATSSGCKATGASVRSRAPPPARGAVKPATGPARREATSAGSYSTARRAITPIDLLLSAVASSPRVLPAVALAPGSLGRGFQPPSPPGSGSGPRFPRPWLPAPERPSGVCGVCLRGQVYSIKSE